MAEYSNKYKSIEYAFKQSLKVNELYVDGLNFAYFFLQGFNHMEKLYGLTKQVRRFVNAAQSSNIKLSIFLDLHDDSKKHMKNG